TEFPVPPEPTPGSAGFRPPQVWSTEAPVVIAPPIGGGEYHVPVVNRMRLLPLSAMNMRPTPSETRAAGPSKSTPEPEPSAYPDVPGLPATSVIAPVVAS